ncbi:SDR family oxidoreductase [Oryzibacter oryziterrae]|uniref:SDR family oxidoreductase n=1 Tax=Oryzibacter oryziterrae TaxID=2766474 RepID=UPI001F472002|nr:SDR family oxidoreductase [Oryzibacter oryziterrae]
MWDFSGSKVMITGAGGGIGRVVVDLFTAAGADVTAIDRDGKLLEPLNCAEKLVFELEDGLKISAVLADHVARNGAPDIVVSNAGYTRAETLDDLNETAFLREIDINLTGSYRVINAVLPAMRAAGRGSIVAVASVNGLAHFGNPAYSAAKAGLIAFIRSIAVELGRDGIRANAVCPGSVMTPAWDHRFARDPAIREKLLGLYPLGRLVTPKEVAQTIAFLASPFASGITGTALAVDAGLTAGQLPFIREILEGQ